MKNRAEYPRRCTRCGNHFQQCGHLECPKNGDDLPEREAPPRCSSGTTRAAIDAAIKGLTGLFSILRGKSYAKDHYQIEISHGLYNELRDVRDDLMRLRSLDVAAKPWENLTSIIRPMIESVCSDGNSNAARLAKDIADAILAVGVLGAAQCSQEPVAWQYRVMFDRGHARENEWCDWRDAGKRYFDKVTADIAAGATRVQTRALCVASSVPSTNCGGGK